MVRETLKWSKSKVPQRPIPEQLSSNRSYNTFHKTSIILMVFKRTSYRQSLGQNLLLRAHHGIPNNWVHQLTIRAHPPVIVQSR